MGTYRSENRYTGFQGELQLLTEGALFHYEALVGEGMDPAAAALGGVVRAWNFLATHGRAKTPVIHSRVSAHLRSRTQSRLASGPEGIELRPITDPELTDPERSPLLYLIPSIMENVSINLPQGDLERDMRLLRAQETIGPSLDRRGFTALSTRESWRTDIGQEMIHGLKAVLGAE